ncbi:MAG TPA: glycoside hydrolase family 30 beta sandwich domain-containing protein [Mucilaginibacter sp.]|jgi:glucosylceramidase
MKRIAFSIIAVALSLSAMAQSKIEWVSTTESENWVIQKNLKTTSSQGKVDAEILTDKPLQTVNGFGGCFNELGWTSLSLLSETDRKGIFKELFAPGVGANFTICRMPVGANDFSLKWYSYDETDGDFAMKDFSIANDMQTLVPFIQNAQRYNPNLKLWASPWSPPQWLKKNKHYAAAMVPSKARLKEFADKGFKMDGMDFSTVENGLTASQAGKEGTDMFVQDPQYFKAYALYFSRFIDAYKAQGINIGMVMPQNEFNSAQIFPSCTWTAKGLSEFVSYLGPEMQQKGVDVFFGTMERPNVKLVDTILTTPASGKYIKGVGFQWAGKGAIAEIHKRYPGLTLYQSEQECGNGKNDWKYCKYTWTLMKHYFNSGANAYMYWNISLKQGGISHWGWKQNSLVSVDTVTKKFSYNHEYYLLKHLSHYVKPGAKLLTISGELNNMLAFKNPDNSIVVVIQNDTDADKTVTLKLGDKTIAPVLKADSFNTLLVR